jgi:tetratricopeptide (TPR) repeat protein
VAAYRKEIDLLEGLDGKWPKDPYRTRMLMLGYSHLGDSLANPHQPNMGDFAGALAAYEKMGHIADGAAAADPLNIVTQLDAAMSAGRLGGWRLAQGDPAAALPSLQKSVVGLERIVAQDPNNHIYVDYLAPNVELVGDAQEALGQFSDARASYARVIALIEPLQRLDPANASIAVTFVESELKWGLILSREGDAKALDHIDLANKEMVRVRSLHPDQSRMALRWARCFGVRSLAGYRLATRSEATTDARAQGLRQAHEDIARAEQILATVPVEGRTAINARDLAVIADTRRLLSESH